MWREQVDRLAADECIAGGSDVRRLIDRPDLVEYGLCSVQQLASRRDVSAGLVQSSAGHHRPRKIVARANAFQDFDRGRNVAFRSGGVFDSEAFTHQPAGQRLEMAVPHSAAGCEGALDQGTRGSAIAEAKIALGKP